jgi:hypothetical protein
VSGGRSFTGATGSRIIKSTDGITWTIFNTNKILDYGIHAFYYITQINKYIFLHIGELGGELWCLLDNSTTWNQIYFNNNTNTSFVSVIPGNNYNPYTFLGYGIDFLYNYDNNTYLLRGDVYGRSYFFTGILSADTNGYIPTVYPKFILNYVYTRTTNPTATDTKYMTYGNGMYLTLDDQINNNGKYLWSTDYLNWNVGTINPTGGLNPNEILFASDPMFDNPLGITKNIFFVNNKFVVFSKNTTNDAYSLNYSYDGINWSRDTNFNNNLIMRTINNTGINFYGCPRGQIINNNLVCILPYYIANGDYFQDGVIKTPYPKIPGTIPTGQSDLCRFIILS